MERPFKDDRPYGPFLAQSSEFSERFLSSGSHTDISEGDVIAVEALTLGPTSSDIKDMLYDVSDALGSDFVTIDIVGGFKGARERGGVNNVSELDVAGVYIRINRLMDQDLSLEQLEEYYHGELQGSSMNVRDLNMAKIDEIV